MTTLIIERRFCGPPESANGGYFAGRVAALAARTVTVQLLRPPPLGVELEARSGTDGTVELLHGKARIAQTRAAELAAPAVSAPSYVEAVEASLRCSGFAHHPFPSCFVCGPQRARGDGLRIFAGSLAERDMVSAPWVADPSLDAGDGKVRPEFMWAALDCPGWFAAMKDARIALLAEFTAHVDRRVYIDERCIVVGWSIGASGRKHDAGTALFDEDGELCAYAHALWIEPRIASDYGAVPVNSR
jgi:hypothetical protein